MAAKSFQVRVEFTAALISLDLPSSRSVWLNEVRKESSFEQARPVSVRLGLWPRAIHVVGFLARGNDTS